VGVSSARRVEWEALTTVQRFHMFMGLFKELLGQAAARTGNQRNAAKNPQGNPKTPGLVQAVLHDALRGFDEPEQPDEGTTPPRGGFTDVGLHTGGVARNTTWPLVRAILQVLLEDHELHGMYRHTMVQLQLWVAEHWLLSLSSNTIAAAQVNVTMQMLAAIQQEAAALADEHLDMGTVEARCAVVRFELENLVNVKARACAANFTVRDDDDFTGRHLKLHPPDLAVIPDESSDMVALRKKAEKILGGCQVR
jgi:hypothetical protein